MFSITNIFNLLSENFFVWSMPISLMILNFINGQAIFDLNIIAAFVIGLIINIVWDVSYLYLNKKKYHKNLL